MVFYADRKGTRSCPCRDGFGGRQQPLARAAALNDPGNPAWSRHRPEAVLEYHFGALGIRETELGPHDQELARSFNNVGAVLVDLGRYAEYLRRADAIFVRVLGENHPVRAAGSNHLGMSRAAAIWRVHHGEDHQRTSNAKSNLIWLLTAAARWTESVEILDEIISMLEAQPDKSHASLAYNLMRRHHWRNSLSARLRRDEAVFRLTTQVHFRDRPQ